MQSLSKVFFETLFIGLVVLWGVGIFSLQFPNDLPWTLSAIKNIVIFSIIFTIISLIIAFFFKKYIAHIFIASAMFMAMGSVGLAPVVAVLYILISSLLLGDMLLNYFKSNGHNDKLDLLLSIFLGLSVLASLLGPMMFFKIHYPITYLFALAIPFFINQKRLHIVIDFGHLFLFKQHKLTLTSQLASITIAYFSFIYLMVVLLPEVGFDALGIHLMIPAYVSNHHFWPYDITQHIWAVMPMNGDWIYTLAYTLGGEYASRLLNYSIFLLILLLLFQVCKHYVSIGKAAWIIVLFLSTPLAFFETGSLFIENFWAGLLFSSTIGLYLFYKTSERKYFLLIAILAGTALAGKLGTIAFIPLLFIFAFYELYRKDLKYRLHFTLLFLVLFVLFGIFPYLNAYLMTGNPIFPFFNAIFKSQFYYSDTSFNMPLFKEGISLNTLYEVTFNSNKYLEATSGAFGFSLFVLLPLSSLMIFVKRNYLTFILVSISLVFTITTFIGQSYLRYIYPALPLFFLLVAIMWEEFTQKKYIWLVRGIVVFSIISIITNMLFLPAAGWHHRDFSIDGLFNQEKKNDFLYAHAPVRKAVDYINLVYGYSAKVGIFAAPYIANLKGTVFTNNWHNYEFSKAILNAKNDKDYLATFKKFSLTHFIITEDQAKSLMPLLKEVTDREFSFNGVSVLRLNSKHQFTRQILINGDFQKGLTNWSKMPNAKYIPETQSVQVSVSNPITQAVVVKSRTRYLIEVSARCMTPDTFFRLQVNWLDKNGNFLTTSLIPKPCGTNFENKSEEITSPAHAVTGIVYAAGHTEQIVEINKVSLKE